MAAFAFRRLRPGSFEGPAIVMTSAMAEDPYETSETTIGTGTTSTVRDGNDRIFRAYMINAGGDKTMGSVWSCLDATPPGRQEDRENSPEGYAQTKRYR